MSDEVQVKRNYHRQRLQEKVTKKEYSLVELESVLETSYRTLLGYVETGKLKGTKVDNRRWVIKAEDIKDFIWNGLPDTGLDRKYIPETHDEIVRKLAAQNKTIEYISDLLGITESTFYKWKNMHESLREAYEQGVSNKVDNVEHSLFEKANGLIVEDVTETYEEDENGNRTGKRKITKTTKQLPPDTNCMTFILRTQRREKWAERYVNSITDNEEAKELLNNIKNILDTGVNDNEDK